MDEILIPIAGILMVTILGSIPLIGLTIRYAIKPTVESIAQAVGESKGRKSGPGVKARLDHVEARVTQIQAALDHLATTSDFDRELSAGGERLVLPRAE